MDFGGLQSTVSQRVRHDRATSQASKQATESAEWAWEGPWPTLIPGLFSPLYRRVSWAQCPGSHARDAIQSQATTTLSGISRMSYSLQPRKCLPQGRCCYFYLTNEVLLAQRLDNLPKFIQVEKRWDRDSKPGLGYKACIPSTSQLWWWAKIYLTSTVALGSEAVVWGEDGLCEQRKEQFRKLRLACEVHKPSSTGQMDWEEAAGCQGLQWRERVGSHICPEPGSHQGLHPSFQLFSAERLGCFAHSWHSA